VTDYHLVTAPGVDRDVEATYQWYEREQAGLGADFIDELRAAYDRIAAKLLSYQEFDAGIRRALLRRFPYAVYFAVEASTVVVLAVLHVSRDPAAWQRRIE